MSALFVSDSRRSESPSKHAAPPQSTTLSRRALECSWPQRTALCMSICGTFSSQKRPPWARRASPRASSAASMWKASAGSKSSSETWKRPSPTSTVVPSGSSCGVVGTEEKRGSPGASVTSAHRQMASFASRLADSSAKRTADGRTPASVAASTGVQLTRPFAAFTSFLTLHAGFTLACTGGLRSTFSRKKRSIRSPPMRDHIVDGRSAQPSTTGVTVVPEAEMSQTRAVARAHAYAESTASFERKSAGASNFSKSSSAYRWRLAESL